MRCQCFYCSIGACYSWSWVHEYKNQHSDAHVWVVWDGSKIICTVLLWERAIDTIDVLDEVQTRRKGFSSVCLQATGLTLTLTQRVTRWETVILNYELVFGECFPFDIIWEIPAWPRKNGNYGEKPIPTRIQNWTRNFCPLFVKLNVDNQYMSNTSYS